MDSSIKYKNPSPRLSANIISRLIFWWIIPLFKYGKNHDLEIKDVYNAVPKDLSHILGDKLERNWKIEHEEAIKTGRKPKLFTAIRKTFLYSYFYYGAWLFFPFMVLKVALPYILGLLIWHFDPRSESTQIVAYAYATGVVACAIVMSLIQHHTNLGQMEIGMRLHIACSSLVYRKILRLSRSSANETAGGQIINLLSNDVARFDQVFVHLHYLWIMPIQGALVAYMMWQDIQIASLAGIFLIAIQTIPFQGCMGKLSSTLRLKIAVKTDERVRLMSEIISGIKVIKMYTWEKPFENLVSMARKYEIDALTLKSYLRGFNKATFVFTERTTLYFTVMAYVLLGNQITASIVFTLAQYFNLIQMTMAIYYPMAISAGTEALVSIKKLENFLLLDENKALEDLRNKDKNNENIGITIKDVTASWAENTILNTLHEITISAKPGKLCAIVGPVGAGKSSLLQLILGELEPRRGHVTRGGSISYASQEPWLFAGSVRNNILFGTAYDEERYRRVTRVCALVKDLLQLPEGDKTLVGERGTSLSGGQRARINLARAVYANADIYLLDDPLSAVDTDVEKEIFDECIMGYLGNKTRIFVTHQVDYLTSVDHIIMLNNGAVIKEGSYCEFQQSYLDLIKSITTEDTNVTRNSPVRSISSHESIVTTSYHEDNIDDIDVEPQKTEELMEKCRMLQSLYWKYFLAGNSMLVMLIFLVIGILAQLGCSGADYWVAHWSNQEELRYKQSNHDNPKSYNNNSLLFDLTNSTESIFHEKSFQLFPIDLETNQTDFNHTINNDISDEPIVYLDRDTALWIYGGFIIASVVMTSARNVMFFKICMNSNKNLHNTMFSRLLHAPMRFFDTNSSGCILNRFSKVVGSINEILPTTMLESIQIFGVVIGILGQVIIIKWWTIFPMSVVAFFFGKIQILYLATGRDVKRLEGVGKNAIFSLVNSSLTGLATIRSAGKQELVKNEFDSHQDVHTGAYYLSIATRTACGLWLDAVTITFFALITYSFVFLDNESILSGNFGLAITQILILCGMLQHAMRHTAGMVAQMTSVERILQFAEIESEGPLETLIPAEKPPKSWPTAGEIKFQNVYLRYDAEDSPVITDMNIIIEAGTKVGIVGHTGAGKSSIISALFNLTKIDGNIFIDGIDTRKIGLHELRGRISMIPQEPGLFSTSLRENLDPFNEYDDLTIWSSLEQVGLTSSVTSLEQPVTQGDTNFSAGQRQLLCLARAIVRNNKILVMDEATANVDPHTDQLIQQTVKKHFQHCTVLTIAQRLNTIMDSDKILVMEHGRVLEYDHPHVLLGNENGAFKKMLDQTGKGMTERLGNISKEILFSWCKIAVNNINLRSGAAPVISRAESRLDSLKLTIGSVA